MRAVVELMISQSAPWAGLKMFLNTVKLNTSNGENWIVGFLEASQSSLHYYH